MAEKNSKIPDDDLVAYLDGELPNERADAIERDLANDAGARQRLQKLELTWDALDSLPAVQPTHSFTKTTMEMVVSSLKGEQHARARLRAKWPLLVLWTAIPLALGLAAFGITNQFRTREYRSLITDLPVIQNFNAYLKLGYSMDFLQQLSTSGLFGQDKTATCTLLEQSIASTAAQMEQNRTIIESLSASDLSSLSRRKDQFDLLQAKDQQVARDFHQSLIFRPDACELLRVAEAFDEWLTTLDNTTRLDLLQIKDVEEKVAKVKSLRELQAGNVDYLPESDLTVFAGWITELAEKYGERATRNSMIRLLPREIRQAAESDPEVAIRIILGRSPRVMEILDEGDLEHLKSQLSRQAQEAMASDLNSQIRVVRQLLTRPKISEAALQAFYFENLTPEERDELDRKPEDMFREEVRRLYMQRKLFLNPQPRRFP